MVLQNVNIVGDNGPVNITVNDSRIADITATDTENNAGHLTVSFKNAPVFPGLINSHDHLDFNLFPQLGGKIFNNYTEWGKHIHAAYKDEIDAVLKIPAALRYEWGIYKNLLCGVTTVVNHGEKTGLQSNLITVFEDTHSLHSVHFEKSWKVKLNNPVKKKLPVNIHVGEGTDAQSTAEIDSLIKFNLLKRKLIGIHGVAMSADQASGFDALVWCPESNYFLLDKTAQIDELQKSTKILFGTDSTLTSGWNIWNHLRLARKTHLLGDHDLYATLNQNPSEVWGINSGAIDTGKDADLVVVNKKADKNGFDAFFSTGPKDILLVVHKGEITLFDESLLPQLQETDLDGYSRVFLGDCCKYIKGNLPVLIKNIRRYQPDAKFPVTINEAVEI
jgi:cytosine/adenosine deaminase-related metal-dependent hydrolase